MKKSTLIIFSLLTIFSQAQWSGDPYVNVPVSLADGDQKDLRMETDGKGGVYVAWKDYRNAEPDIYIQRLDSNGVVLWSINGAEVCIESHDQSTPAITSDEKDGVIVAWSDRRQGIKERDIYAQRIDPNGNIMWDTHGVPVATRLLGEHAEKIISDDNSGVIVVWEQERILNGDTTLDIWAQRIDSSGNAVWEENGIAVCLQDSMRRNHKAQRDGEGGAFIIWQDRREGIGNYNIYGQHINSDGALLWDPQGVSICNALGNQTNPKIDPEKTNDGIYVTWVDKRNNIDYDIYTNKIDSLGNVLWGSSGKPVIVAQGNQSALDFLSNNKTKGLIVTWKDFRDGQYDIYVQKLDKNGDQVWDPEGVVVCNAPGDQLNPNIISDKHGGAIIVWQDQRGFNWDVYAQRISHNGNNIWQENGEEICLANGSQKSPKNVPDNKGGVIIAWEDKRNGFFKDIYIDHLLIEDTVTYPIVIEETGVVFLQNHNINVYPNPFVKEIIIDFNTAIILKYEMVDILGRKILFNYSTTKNKTTLILKNKLAKGNYEIILETTEGIVVIPVVKN